MSKYTPQTLQQKLGWLVEECGEVQAAVGKTLRWGLQSVNPELPEVEQETNVDWLLREMDDLVAAISLARDELNKRRFNIHKSYVAEMPPLDPPTFEKASPKPIADALSPPEENK